MNQSRREHIESSDPERQSRGDQKKDWTGPEGSRKSAAERQSNREREKDQTTPEGSTDSLGH